MLKFNEAISKLCISEIPLKGCKYTWTNKQLNPLLERLDSFFSSNAWTSYCPITMASALSRDTSDHTPCVITASTKVPKPLVFRFENFWLHHSDFPSVLQESWTSPTTYSDKARIITAKLKSFRRSLKNWNSQLPNLATTIQNTKDTILFLDTIEEARDLALEEWNFMYILHDHLNHLLHQQKVYWQQRGTINWVKFGDECTEFFHANATIRRR